MEKTNVITLLAEQEVIFKQIKTTYENFKKLNISRRTPAKRTECLNFINESWGKFTENDKNIKLLTQERSDKYFTEEVFTTATNMYEQYTHKIQEIDQDEENNIGRTFEFPTIKITSPMSGGAEMFNKGSELQSKCTKIQYRIS